MGLGEHRAVVQRQYGPPAVLAVERVGTRPLADDAIRLRTLASAVNFSDLQIRAGRWPIRRAEPFPYVPGLETVGEVVEVGAAVPDWRVGDRAVTMMQGLGGVRAERPGGYAELVTIAADAAAAVPAGVDPVDAATVGLAGVTAHEGLARLGPLAGRTVVVTGATGGVGAAAVAIAALDGARPVAVVSSRAAGSAVDRVTALGAADVLSGATLAGALPPGSVDAVLDSVAGPLFEPLVAALRPGGAYSVVGAAGGGRVSWDVYALLAGITLTGWTSETLDGPALRRAWGRLAGWLAADRLPALPRTVFALADAARAHELLESRQLAGRAILVPD